MSTEHQPKLARRKNAPVTDPAGPRRVLIVDDHPVTRRGLVQLINQQADLEVCAEAESYEQALAAVQHERPNLAIVDLTLKDISGLELTKQLHEIMPQTPVLMLSMHDESTYANRALRAGALGYIMKREQPDKLISAVRTVLRGEVYLSEAMASRMLGKYVRGRRTAEPEHAESEVSGLSDRELEVFELLGRGLSTRQIAERLHLSIKTIESHRENIKTKLNFRNAAELVWHATQWVMSEEAG